MFFPFLEKISPPPNQKCKEHFSAGYASGASGGGAISFIDFENRCELGKIETPSIRSRSAEVLRFWFVVLNSKTLKLVIFNII